MNEGRSASMLGAARGAVVLLASWGGLVLVGGTRLFRDPGTFWHVLTGRRVLEFGFPTTDWLTFSREGAPWIAHQWLAEVAMATLDAFGGFDALLLATTFALAVLFCWLGHRMVAAGVEPRWAVLLCTLVLLASAGHLHVRPHVASIILFAWVYSRLIDVEAGRIGLRSLAALVPVFVVWVNCHGAVLGGVATLWLAAAAWIALWIGGAASPVSSRREALALAGIALACGATIFVNPYGLELVRTWLAIVGSPVLPQVIVEHASIPRNGSWEVVVFMAVYAVVLASAPRTAMLRTSSVLPLVWAVLGWSRVRHAPLFAMAAALALPGLLRGNVLAEWASRRGVHVLRSEPPRRRFTAALAAACPVALAVVLLVRSMTPHGAAIARLDPTWWPTELLPALRAAQANAGGGGIPILNEGRFGGFVEYYAPGFRVLVDDRCELFGDDFVLAEVRGSPEWYARWVERYDVRHALAFPDSMLARFLRADGRWKQVASSAAGALYERPVVARSIVPAAATPR